MEMQIKQDILALHKPITKQLRSLAKTYKKVLNAVDIPQVFELVETLLQVGDFKHSTVAYQILWDQSNRFEQVHFPLIDHIVTTYIHDWWDCDDVFTHAFANYFLRYPDMLEKTISWTRHERFGVRRSAAIALLVPAKKHMIPFAMIETICNILYDDPHYLVIKGYGWLLKEASVKYHDEVVTYLNDHVSTMPRTAFRYALEKLPQEERQYLMSL